MTEAKITHYLKKRLKELKIFHIKLSDRYHSGIPDLYVANHGRSYWVELKAEGEQPTPIQLEFAKQLRKAGAYWCWMSSKQEIDSFIKLVSTL